MAEYNPFFIKGKGRKADIVICCDHGSNFVPDFVCDKNFGKNLGGNLGLAKAQMRRHIAYDIGAKGVALGLGALLDAPVIGAEFSRLVIDPNRGVEDPTLIMRLSDGAVIPANRGVGADERAMRIDKLYNPYHRALAGLIKTRKDPKNTCVISIHSFTPKLHNQPIRPWHVGVLFAEDRRLSDALIARLKGDSDMCIGVNQPYCGHLAGDTMSKHALQDGLPHVLIELRNDLIETDSAQDEWAYRLAPMLKGAIGDFALKEK